MLTLKELPEDELPTPRSEREMQEILLLLHQHRYDIALVRYAALPESAEAEYPDLDAAILRSLGVGIAPDVLARLRRRAARENGAG
jgi:hypothetical protein